MGGLIPKAWQGTYFKPEGVLSTFYPASVNANLVEMSDGPFEEKHTISFPNKETEVVETSARESSTLNSHLVRLMDLLMAPIDKMEDLSSMPTIQIIISQVLEHQRWVQTLLSDSVALLSTNTMLV